MEKGKIYTESGELIRELKVGNESAFNSLFHRRYKDLCRFAWSFTSNYAVAEDIVQELFSNIWHKKGYPPHWDSLSFINIHLIIFNFTLYLRCKL